MAKPCLTILPVIRYNVYHTSRWLTNFEREIDHTSSGYFTLRLIEVKRQFSSTNIMTLEYMYNTSFWVGFYLCFYVLMIRCVKKFHSLKKPTTLYPKYNVENDLKSVTSYINGSQNYTKDYINFVFNTLNPCKSAIFFPVYFINLIKVTLTAVDKLIKMYYHIMKFRFYSNVH